MIKLSDEEEDSKSEWTPIETPEEEEPEECEECLEETTGSFYIDEEEAQRTEEALKQELTVKQAEHQYRLARDVKALNIGIIMARQLGAIRHLLKRSNDLYEEYIGMLKIKHGMVSPNDNPVNKTNKVYETIPKDLRDKVTVNMDGDKVVVRPNGFLGKETWRNIMDSLRPLDAEWKSLGKNSHWKIP